MTMTLFDPTPIARRSDPSTAHEAAAVVKSGSTAMNAEIVAAVAHHARYDPDGATAFQIARRVCAMQPDRWEPGSIRTAISRLAKIGKIRKVDEGGISPRGQACSRYLP